MKKINFFVSLVALAMTFSTANAQDPDEATSPEGSGDGFGASVDFTTTTIWRGGYLGGAAVQPSMSYSFKGLEAGMWASTNFSDEAYKELDFYVSYAIGGFSVTVTDYAWDITENTTLDYFGPYKKTHRLEAGLGFDFSEVSDLPLSVGVYTMVAGADRKSDGSDKQAHPTYLELSYAPSLKNGFDLALTLGAAIEDKNGAYLYSEKDGFNFVNVDIALSKTFAVKSGFTITPKVELAVNPTGFSEDPDIALKHGETSIHSHGKAVALAGLSIGF